MPIRPKNLKTDRSAAALKRAEVLMPGGVSSPVRAFRAVGGSPLFIARGRGSRIYDVDGNRFIDYVGSWGPLILGHTHPAVVKAVRRALARGASFGAPTEAEADLAERVTRAMPWVEQLRFVNSGTEAVMSAVRLARAATGRPGIIKFDGCYHGHSDALLVKAGSGAMTLGTPSSPGVPAETVQHTHLAAYNDLDAVARLCEAHRGQLAAVIVEPVAGNMGVVPPREGFLQGLRDLADRHGMLLILDEVMTGFRVAPGGAAALYGVRPDLVTLGKIIGGGLPVGAYGGRRDLMQNVSPVGPVYQAGTLSGNPLAMAAGIAALEALAAPGTYEALEAKSRRLEEGLAEAVREAFVPSPLEGEGRVRGRLERGISPLTPTPSPTRGEGRMAARVQRVGSMLTLFFSGEPVTDAASAARCDTAAFGRFFGEMLRRGIYLPPSQFEAWFVSLAHTEADIDRTIRAARAALKA